MIASQAAWVHAAPPKRVIFMIGDGMGPVQVAAAGMYVDGVPGGLSFESLPAQGEVTTFAANNVITDSAAAATAMATGFKVNNKVISVALPGDGAELETILERFRSLGRRTGLVTTTTINHATPAAFAAHEESRVNIAEIAADYWNQTTPNVIFGGGSLPAGVDVAEAMAAGYSVVTDRAGMAGLVAGSEEFVLGLFTSGNLPYEYDYFVGTDTRYDDSPHLSEMTATALDLLGDHPDGFFLMVEGGRIDHAGHVNSIERNIFETLEFADTVQIALDWAAGRADTLVVVAADHETGGLSIDQNNGAGVFPSVSWSTTSHTSINVPVYAWGPNASLFAGTIDNTDFFDSILAFDGSVVGDTNCDGLFDLDDVASFVWALVDPAMYGVTFPDCNPALADMNGDSLLDGEDALALVEALLGG